MSIKINQPLVVATTQAIEIISTSINHREGFIEVFYEVRNQNGDVVKSDTERFTGQEAENFWQEYTSKQSVYELLVAKLGFVVEVPEMTDTLIN